ncbi:chaperone modulator CbpM [Lutibacter sp.]
MSSESLISIQQICKHYDIPVSFINSLNEFGIIEIEYIDNDKCIYEKHLNQVEKMMRLHYDLNINFEGIDVINNLLQRTELLENEIRLLKNRLLIYEDL